MASLKQGKAFVLFFFFFFESQVCTFRFAARPTNYVAWLGLDSGESLQMKEGERQAVHTGSC